MLKYSLYTLVFALMIAFAVPQNGFAQFRIHEDIGGGNNDNGQVNVSDNDNSTIYILGGVVLAGILVYGLVLKNDDKPEVEADTVAVNQTPVNVSSSIKSNFIQNEITHVKKELPVDFYFGIKNNQFILRDKTYLVGVRLKL